MKKTVAVLLVVLFAFSGCFTQTHIVGDGAKGPSTESAKTWYILWGLVPLNHVDTHAMAQGAKDYTITTQFTFLDWVIAIFTSFVTIYPMTVQVQR